jgi:hypothetical protein
LLEATYQGSRGVRLLNNWDINQIPLDVSSDVNVLRNIFTASQNFKPYPHGSIQHYSNYGDNSYHGGTWRVEKRYSAGLVMNAFYTFSKSLNNGDNDGGVSGITFYNRALEKGRANYDIRHRFVSVLTYELPFGKGRKFMNRGGIFNALFGGWDFAYTQTFRPSQSRSRRRSGYPGLEHRRASRPDSGPGSYLNAAAFE